MSIYWSLKKRMTDKEYVVVRHPLRFNGNLTVGGIKFCAGCGVVEKDSKAYRDLFKLPMFRKARTLPLDFLKKAGFKPKEVQLVYGPDIYYHYIKSIGLNQDLTPITTKEIEQPFDEVKVEELTEETSSEPEQEEPEEEKVVAMEPEEVEEIKEELAEELTEESEDLPELSTDEIVEAHKLQGKCIHVLEDGTVCDKNSSRGSVSGYCFGHLKLDPKRKNYGKKERRRRKKTKEEA
jgi:hypothetical protein